MLSRSAVVKLKAILIIDLIIVAAAASCYVYFEGEGLLSSAAKPAEFIYTDLTIAPLEAYVGEAIQISVNLTNIGELEGNETVNILINNSVKYIENVTLGGNSSQIIDYSDLETAAGVYMVKVGNLSGTFTLKALPPESSRIVLSDMTASPYETWPNEPVRLTATATNPSSSVDTILVKASVDDAVVTTKILELAAWETQTIQLAVNTTIEGRHVAKINTLQAGFYIVKTGCHTLIINRSGGGSTRLSFTLNGETHYMPYQEVLPAGKYTLKAPDPVTLSTGVLAFEKWTDGTTSATDTFDLNQRTILVATYKVISGYASCPSLYIWNGTGYSYVTDVSNSGWLGYIGYINGNGKVIFSGGNPWDYVKLNKNILKQNGGYFDMTLSQQWDELFYLDSAHLLVVDHPVGTDVYTSMTNYLNKGSTGQIYTVSNLTFPSPLSAINEKGQNVLSQLLQIDGRFTPGVNVNESPSYNNLTYNQLTLDLGNLSGAPQIKLILNGMVDWGPADAYYAWINTRQAAVKAGLLPNGTEVTPSSFLEVRAADGNWIRVPQDRQIPIPSDYNARTFAVDLTGLFPAGLTDYQIRLTNYWNVTYDYIGIDTTPTQSITVQTLTPSSAVLSQFWDTQSTSSGAFTRYGDVTPLMQAADDMYVIGRQCDQVNMKFSTANLTPVAPGMERDYFFVVACWFKDPPGAWGYGFDFTTNPLPFLAMSGFPYITNQENYPYDAAHIAYLQEWNTRIINPK